MTKKCRHIVGSDTTLHTRYVRASGEIRALWICECLECGKSTDLYKTYQEAIAKAQEGSWKDE